MKKDQKRESKKLNDVLDKKLDELIAKKKTESNALKKVLEAIENDSKKNSNK